MTLYARGDVQSVTVSGGCGQSHRRPLNEDGNPERIFELNCPPCEHVLAGNDQQHVLEFAYKRDKGGHLITNSQGHAIQDGIQRRKPNDPHWTNDINDLPKTGAEIAADIKEDERRARLHEERSRRAEDLRTFSALVQIPGADPRKLAENLGLDLSALGLDDDEGRPPRPPRKPRATTPKQTPGSLCPEQQDFAAGAEALKGGGPHGCQLR